MSIDFILNRGKLTLHYDRVTIPITIKRNVRYAETLYGYENFDDYPVTAMASISDIEIKVHLDISASAEKIEQVDEKCKHLEYDLYTGDEKCTTTTWAGCHYMVPGPLLLSLFHQ